MIFNIKPLSKSSEDKVTGFAGKGMEKISLFIDDATPEVPSCFPYCGGADLKGWDMSGQKLYSDFSNADLRPKVEPATNLSNANLTGANLTDAIWGNTICPDGTMNSGTSPCTAEQLNLA